MAYDPDAYPPFAVTADLVVLTLREQALHALLVRRGGKPFAGRWALPGGFGQVDGGIEDAAYRGLAAGAGVGSDAADARWWPVADLLSDPRKLAFDHAQILGDAVERARAKLEYSTLATAFCPAEFTVGELRAVYEAVWGASLDPRNFHRKVTGAEGFLVETGERTTRGGGQIGR